MCFYRYVYFSQCQHAELTRISYCDWDKTLYQPLRDDYTPCPAFFQSSGQPRCEDVCLFSRQHSSPADNSTLSYSSGDQQAGSLQYMSTAMPSKSGLSLSWANASDLHDDLVRRADLIPRPVQNNAGIKDSSTHVHSQHNQPPSRVSQSLHSTGHNGLEIDVPLEAHNSLSMEFTQTGKFEEVVTRFDSIRDREGFGQFLSDDTRAPAGDTHTRAYSASAVFQESNTETIRGSSIDHSPNHQAMRRVPEQFPQNVSLADGGGPTPKDPLPVSPTRWSRGHQGNTKGKGDGGKAHDYEEEELDSHSARMPIPAQWIARTAGPILNTELRAMQRESRKQALDPRTARSTNSSAESKKYHGSEVTTFLTKDAITAVESDITSASARSGTKLRHTPSKTASKSPIRSPVRASPGQLSTIKSTLSPTRAPRMSNYGPTSNLTETANRSRGPGSVTSLDSSNATATHSPVSQSTRSSVMSFVTAFEHHDAQIPAPGMTDAGENEQMAKMKDVNRRTVAHSRGKSEPHPKLPAVVGKATLSRPAVPQLSLRIPHTSSLFTDCNTPLSLRSVSSSAPVTSESSHSSRIPRISTSIKPRQERSIATFRRTKSARALAPDMADEIKHADTGNQLHAQLNSEESPGSSRAMTMSLEPQNIPLPETLLAAPRLSERHIRTINGSSKTPITFKEIPTPSATAFSSSTSQSSSPGDGSTIMGTAPANKPLAQDPPDKHPMVASYLKQTGDALDPVEVTVAPPSTETADARSPGGWSGDKAFNIDTCDSQVASEATVRDMRFIEHIIEGDCAIVSSRNNTDVSGAPRPSLSDEGSSIASIHTDPSLTLKVRHGKSPVEDRSQHDDRGSRQAAGESSSLHSGRISSDLRATAPIFVPKQPSDTTPIREGLTTEWTGLPPFDPFALDINGIPFYHHLHSVSIGPGTYFDYSGNFDNAHYSNSGPYMAPSKKGKNKRGFSTGPQVRGRRRRGLSEASPTKINKPSEATRIDSVLEGAADDTTSRVGPRLSSHDQQTCADDDPTGFPRAYSKKPIPFTAQLESMSQQPVARNEKGSGRAPRQIDWSYIHTTPIHVHQQRQHLTTDLMHCQSKPPTQSQGACIGFEPHILPPFQHTHGRQRNRGGNGLYDNLSIDNYQKRNAVAAAGLPLNATAPFPDPIPPSGRHSNYVDGGSPKDYVGYAVSNERKSKEVCREIDIEEAFEWVGQACNQCEPDH
ncbi:hypothetical protein CC78DRAFT_268930 [Lojkania enalia]|uniref:Uncharacterized protein n=1 Tax=Lojkania enalia TaxID=147567 RepID=A0A9P4KCK1_9PLEO|nr:hypothetical protein CC78DRAFT_268930 [Didymosphaeria enalia]